MQQRDIINIFAHWCKINSGAIDVIMSNDDSALLPWHFTGKGNTGVLFKCAGAEFPLSILTCKADGIKWHASVITGAFISRFREIVRNFQASDTPVEILRLENVFNGTRFERSFYDRLKMLQDQGPAKFYRKLAVLRAKKESIFIQTGTTSADLIAAFGIQTGSNLRDDLTKLVCFPENVVICISALSEKIDAVMATAKVSAITPCDANIMLFFSDLSLETFTMPCNIKYK